MQHRKKFQVKLPEEQPRRKQAPSSTPRALGSLPPDLTVPQGGFAPTPTLDFLPVKPLPVYLALPAASGRADELCLLWSCQLEAQRAAALS